MDVFDCRVREEFFCHLILIPIGQTQLSNELAIPSVSGKGELSSTVHFRNGTGFSVPFTRFRMNVDWTGKRWNAQFLKWVVGKKEELLFIYADKLQAMTARCTSRRCFQVRGKPILWGLSRPAHGFRNLRGNRHYLK
jgi:hypothetical protein